MQAHPQHPLDAILEDMVQVLARRQNPSTGKCPQSGATSKVAVAGASYLDSSW